MTETKTHVILLSCGSFNPITRGHVHMFGEEGGGGDEIKATCMFTPQLSRVRSEPEQVPIRCQTSERTTRKARESVTQATRPVPQQRSASHHQLTTSDAR